MFATEFAAYVALAALFSNDMALSSYKSKVADGTVPYEEVSDARTALAFVAATACGTTLPGLPLLL